jgi:glutathione S-transferase
VEGKLPQKSNKFVVKKINHRRRKKQSLCAGFPFGKLPILEMDGMKMHQSAAIIRYLARKAGGTLYGRNQFEALQCDVAYDTISDLRVSELTRGP